eukprot:m.41045 g.41045  ORF g.41045 m.41045 type:complete len:64 (+) comp46112_c0_seq1:34-225(+)
MKHLGTSYLSTSCNPRRWSAIAVRAAFCRCCIAACLLTMCRWCASFLMSSFAGSGLSNVLAFD